MTEKICENCIHYDYHKCSVDGTYTGKEWFCELWESFEDD